MANNRIAGVCYLKVDGKSIEARGSWKTNIGRMNREGIAGQDGVHGFKEMPRVPMIEGEISYVRGIRIRDIEKITDAEITLELANGVTHVLHNAWYAGDGIEVDAEGGKFSAKFEGYTGDEQV